MACEALSVCSLRCALLVLSLNTLCIDMYRQIETSMQ